MDFAARYGYLYAPRCCMESRSTGLSRASAQSMTVCAKCCVHTRLASGLIRVEAASTVSRSESRTEPPVLR